MQVMVIDDSKHIRLIVREMLEKMKHTCLEAEDGQDALSVLETQRPDLILLDWNMPILDGPGFLKAYCSRPNACPVVMMTTENAMGKITQALGHGAQEYIIKPFTQDILESKINFVINNEVKCG